MKEPAEAKHPNRLYHAISFVLSAGFVTSDRADISIAMKGPISLPDGEMTPIIADISRIPNEDCVAKVMLVKIDKADPIINVCFLPNRSAIEVRNMLIIASPTSVNVNINPISESVKFNFERYISNMTAKKPKEKRRSALQHIKTTPSVDNECSASEPRTEGPKSSKVYNY